MTRTPIIWAILQGRTGDDNQVLALAEALGLPFITKSLRYNLVRGMTSVLGPTLVTVDRASRKLIAPPWPDLILGSGRRVVPVARWIRKRSGNRTRIVMIGHQRRDTSLFDLVVTTPQYPVPPSDNVLLLSVAMSRFSDPPKPTEEELKWLDGLDRPRRLVALGGSPKYWELTPQIVVDAIDRLAAKPKGSLIIVSSRRTSPEVIEAAKEKAAAIGARVVTGRFPRFAALLGDADEVFVTGDSVSMISEAIVAGKPVGLIPITRTAYGERKLGDEPLAAGPGARRRDIRRFWHNLEQKGLIGTIEHPLKGDIQSPVDAVVRRVRKLIGLD